MGICPADCGTLDILGNPDNCVLEVRNNRISRFAFYPCNVSLPGPLTPSAIEDLIADGTIVYTSPLSNVTLNDPTYTDVVIADCVPARRVIQNREITFNDKIAITLEEGSPVVTTKYFDYDFWADKQDKTLSLNWIVEYCNGDNVIAKDTNGLPLSADLKVFINFEGDPGATGTEFKAASAIFNGDPISVNNKPAFNRAADGTVTLI